MDWRLIYRILVGNSDLFHCWPDVGSKCTDLREEPWNHHQGMCLLNSQMSHDHSLIPSCLYLTLTFYISVASFHCHFLSDCSSNMASISLVHGSMFICGNKHVVLNRSQSCVQTLRHCLSAADWTHFHLLLWQLDSYPMHSLSRNPIGVFENGKWRDCWNGNLFALAHYLCSSTRVFMRLEPDMDVRSIQTHCQEVVDATR